MNSPTYKCKPLDRPEMWSQLENAIIWRASQDQIIWTIFGAFWGANAILLVALFTTGKLPDETAGIVISFVGISLSVVWYFIQKRAIGSLKRFEVLISKLEKSLEMDPSVAVSADINEADYEKYVGHRKEVVRQVMKLYSFAFFLLWFFGFFYFLGSATI